MAKALKLERKPRPLRAGVASRLAHAKAAAGCTKSKASRARSFVPVPSLLWLAMTMVFLSGCSRRSNHLEGFGVIESPGGNWKVEVLTQEPGLLVTDLTPTEGMTEVRRLTGMKLCSSISPSDWVSSSNAYVFIDQEDRVWAFNGTDQTFVLELHERGSRSWSVNTWPGEIPPEFLRRLPEAVRNRAQKDQ